MRAKKHLGQHFLTSRKALKEMIEATHITSQDTVVEIGPGKGILTKALLETGARVIAIETDADMVAMLRTTFEQEIATTQLELLHADILETSIQSLVTHPYKVVANIPYYITGEIIRRFLSTLPQPTDMTLLVQKEVAQRIARSPKESILSLSVKIYGSPRYVATVPARYFSPSPKVDSAILNISSISKQHFTTISEVFFFKVVKKGFSSKRKQVVNNLTEFASKEALVSILLELGLTRTVRAEDIPLTTWIILVHKLSLMVHQ